MRKTNYHSHTYRCNHASGKDEQYVLSAIDVGFEIYGFSDHTPWPFHPFEWDYYRMEISDLDGYLKSVESLKEKYKDKITIYTGLEAEYIPDRMDWLKKLKEDKLDFLIFGNHYFRFISPDRFYGSVWTDLIEHYLDDSYNALSSGIYDFFAHPDFFLRSIHVIDRKCEDAFEKLCLWAKEFNTPLEYNLSGYNEKRKFPCDKLFQLAAKHEVPVILNGDYHRINEVLDIDLYIERKSQLEKWGCVNNF